MRFADYAKIYVTSGNGGSGMAHFRREKFVPRGGPDGGDGGKGGDVILRGNPQLNTLLDLRYRKFIKASHGENGGSSRKKGKDGENEILTVPLGTVAFDADTKARLGEITAEGEEIVVAEGGRGGLGNWHFRSATNQTPQHYQPGEEGVERTVELELKLIADVGLVGFPNAGKSTLLSVLSEARPKIADYPFTTLEPNLGVVTFSDYRSFVMADIPGIIEDAHEGKGLGIQFLRHIERNNLLLFILAADSDLQSDYQALLHELKSYRPDLLQKPRMIAISKMDLYPGYELEEIPVFDKETDVVLISSATGHNIELLKEKIWSELNDVGEKETL
ncbi:MAG: GTPase ObgE [Balneolaceae bacterium]|nr:MAG: GTPase ObgE [Balneolaceae bacterium]